MSVATMAPAALVTAVMAPAPGLFAAGVADAPLAAAYFGQTYLGGSVPPVALQPGTAAPAAVGVATMKGA